MRKTTNTTKVQYTFNHANKVIKISKRFANAAEKFNSPEYKQFVQLVADFPTYSIEVVEIKKKENKVSYKGLSIDEMKRFIKSRSEEEAELFEKVITIAKNKTSPYAVIKKWFLKKYKEAYLNEVANAELDKLEAELDELDNEVNETTVNTTELPIAC